jgi:parallel beta-helix repeat protein
MYFKTVLFVILISANVHAVTTYYVAQTTNASDGNPGTSTAPFRTILYAIGKVAAGDTIIVRSGIYTEYQIGWGMHFNKSGITLQSEVPLGAIIDMQNKSDSHHAVYLDGSNNIIKGFKIRNGLHGGITVYGSNNKIIGNEVYNNGNAGDPASALGHDGIYSDPNARSNSYIGNYVHHNGRLSIGTNLDHGFYLCADNELVMNNISAYNASRGIQISGRDSTVENLKIYNNVLAFNNLSGIVIWQSMSNIEIKNNIIYKNKTYGIETSSSSGNPVAVENNIISGNVAGNIFIYPASSGPSISLAQVNSYNVNPLFMNESGDFHIQSGSPARDKGLSLSVVTNDFDGNARPQNGLWDIGAFEFGGGTFTKPAPPQNLKAQ